MVHILHGANAKLNCMPLCLPALKDGASRGASVRIKVVFDFNGVAISAAAGDTPEQLAAHYRTELERRQREWAESEEGKRFAAAQRRILDKLQKSADAMRAELDAALCDQSKLVDWVMRFSRFTDHTGLHLDEKTIADKLVAAGYAENAEVGAGPQEIRAEKNRMARYIIGQAIFALRSGMPLHPMCASFAEDYAATFGH